MDSVSWESKTTTSNGTEAASYSGQYDILWERRQKRLKEFEKKKNARAQFLSENGLAIGGGVSPSVSCVGTLQQQTENSVNQSMRKTALQKYFQKGLKRREQTAVEKRIRDRNAMTRTKCVEEKFKLYGDIEKQKAERRNIRNERIYMKLEDEAAIEERKIFLKQEARQQRFLKSKEYMQHRVDNGFFPSPQHGRVKYFAKLGINKKFNDYAIIFEEADLGLNSNFS